MRSIRKTITLSTLLWVGLMTAAGQVIIDRAVNHWLTSQFDNALEAKARALVTLTKNDGNEVELYVDNQEIDWKNNPMMVLSPIKPLVL